jgi:hypothetical protein
MQKFRTTFNFLFSLGPSCNLYPMKIWNDRFLVLLDCPLSNFFFFDMSPVQFSFG